MYKISHSRQRGAAALVVSMLLLFTSSIVVFYLNRGLIFEQKTSANQLRSTAAFEVAEAGIEWATGMLNNTNGIDVNCAAVSPNTSFLRRYIQTGFPGNTNVAVTTNTFPGCKINGTTLNCRCPVPGGAEQVADPGGAVQSSFTVAFAAVNDPATGAPDPTAVRLTATGCTPQAGMCKPLTASSGATTGASDANATTSVILKLSPTLRAIPNSALTCGTSCNISGSYDVINREVASNGYIVNAGTTINAVPGASFYTIPGQPVQNAMIPGDTSLSSLSNADGTCSNDAMFSAYFGRSIESYAASSAVAVIPNCTPSSTCRPLVLAAYANNKRSFYFPDGMSLNSSPGGPFTLGTLTDGVQLVSPGDIEITGNITINGLIFSNSSTFTDLGTGTANVNGAIITCAGYSNNGSGTLTYTSSALGGSGLGSGVMVRVPGSWRDQAVAF